ncbi:antibiotic biosynthesis monooxygenase family protein [Kutzneria sp. NPDC052558]|uniref:antibiotic biosynthesis monooxygenase family protein n=1 Tax=Kutzneria sp. NPDC052558 TaxID=3364121 RepID=UPI0037CA4092
MTLFVRVALTVHDGRQAEFEETAKALAAQANAEEGTLSYRWFSDGPGSYTVLEEYADADASAAHNKAGRELLAKLNEVATITTLDIYGELNDRLRSLVDALPTATAHSEAI